MKVRVNPRVSALFLRTYLGALHSTLRVRQHGLENILRFNPRRGQYILAFWHGHLALMVYAPHHRPMTVMISQHRDGELIARTMELFGVDVARGSTTRGGAAALRAMLREAQQGKNLAFTPDGPRGPRRIVQPGVIAAAQFTGLPIVPVVISSERKRVLKSWDQMEVPRFFSRIIMAYGEPLEVARGADVENNRVELEARMNDLADSIDEKFAKLWPLSQPGGWKLLT